MTATAVQPQAPQMDIQQVLPQQASTAKPGQSFKDVMQAAQQKIKLQPSRHKKHRIMLHRKIRRIKYPRQSRIMKQ